MRSIMVLQRAALEHKSLNTPLSDNTRLFAPKKVRVPTLKEHASLVLIEQLGSVESVEEFIKQNSENLDKGLFDCMTSILAKIKKLHGYVVKNNLEAVDEFLNTTPQYLLPVLLKTKSINQTFAKGRNNHVIVEGSALMMAIGAKAVGRDGCDLCLIPSHSPRENTTLKRLALYSDNNPDSPLRYVVEGKKFTIERGDGEGQLSPAHFTKLKAMFKNPLLYNKNLNLDQPALNEAQRDSYAALLKITEKRNHTLFVNEEGMMELLHRHIRRALPGDEGEHEIARQTLEQLPEGYEEKEDKQFTALRTIRKAIADSTSNEDPKLEAAFDAFINHFEPEAKGILRTGTYGKERELLAALEIGDEEYFYDYRKDDLWYNKVVSWLERLQQDNVKHDIAQGLRSKLDLGKKSNCSLKYSYGEGHFDLSGTPRSGIGFDSWVDLYWGRPVGGGAGRIASAWRVPRLFRSYVQTKTAALRNIRHGETYGRQKRVGAS